MAEAEIQSRIDTIRSRRIIDRPDKWAVLTVFFLTAVILLIPFPLKANRIVTLPEKNLLEVDIEQMLHFNLFNPGVSTGKLLKNVVYKEVQGRNLKMDVYIPEGDTPHPVIIYFHGGFFLRGDKKEILEFKPLLQAFLKKNWLVISANYRLLDRNTSFPLNLEDVKDTVRWVRKNAERISADPARVGLMGYSAGGNLALMAGLTDNDAFTGCRELSQYSSEVDFIISGSGPTRLYGVNDFGFDLEKTLISYFYGDELSIELLKRASPLTYLEENAPPILLIHGTEDVIVPYTQAEAFYQRAGEIGADCALIKIKGGGHTIRLTYLARIKSLTEEVLYFIDNHTGDSWQPRQP